MIIESENQYQQALKEVEMILGNNGGLPPGDSTTAGIRLMELTTEIKLYENKYHKEGQEVETYEFWSAKKGVIPGESVDPNDYEIIKLKENELTKTHIDILVGEFISGFEKLPAAARRIIRNRLKY